MPDSFEQSTKQFCDAVMTVPTIAYVYSDERKGSSDGEDNAIKRVWLQASLLDDGTEETHCVPLNGAPPSNAHPTVTVDVLTSPATVLADEVPLPKSVESSAAAMSEDASPIPPWPAKPPPSHPILPLLRLPLHLASSRP